MKRYPRVIPAKAGTHDRPYAQCKQMSVCLPWVYLPAFAGMTRGRDPG
jgi:hypothetical protein